MLFQARSMRRSFRMASFVSMRAVPEHTLLYTLFTTLLCDSSRSVDVNAPSSCTCPAITNHAFMDAALMDCCKNRSCVIESGAGRCGDYKIMLGWPACFAKCTHMWHLGYVWMRDFLAMRRPAIISSRRALHAASVGATFSAAANAAYTRRKASPLLRRRVPWSLASSSVVRSGGTAAPCWPNQP